MSRLLAAALPLILSACIAAAPPPPSGRPGAPGDGGMPGTGLGLPGTEREAVRACRDQAAGQGLNVRGIDRTVEVTDGGGMAIGQNVFLAVSRGGQDVTIRCAYTYATDEARIMTL